MSWMGPRENRHRPAIDTLFRSAARVYRSRTIAVVLSGALDDGSAGALAVKARGGKVLVQDPDEAEVSEMPANVLNRVKADYCLPVGQLAKALVRIVSKSSPMKSHEPSPKECEAAAFETSLEENEAFAFTCPDCGGAVTQIQDGHSIQFRCHVGHRFSLDSFTEAHTNALERAMWVALRKLNEQRTLMKSLAEKEPDRDLKKRYLENETAAEDDMRLLHEIMARL